MSGTAAAGTTILFQPSPSGPFTFGATLDGDNYVCTVTWNIARQGWYLNVYTTTSTLVCAKALIASTPDYPINLVFGYFVTSTLVFYDAQQAFVVTP